MTVLASAGAEIEALLRKYNPLQPRDQKGRWSDGMPDELVSIAVKVLGGTVTASAKHDGDGRATLSANGRSVDLDGHDLNELRKTIVDAQYGGDSKAGSDGVFRVTRHHLGDDGKVHSEILVSLRPVEGAFISETGKKASSQEDPSIPDEEIYNAEFDLVVGESDDGDFGDEPSTRVSLKDLDQDNRKGVFQALERATDARRIDTGNGPTDVFSPRPGAVGLRMKDDDGNPTEVILNARDVRQLDSAMSDVLYGEGEGEDDLSIPRDARSTVETSGGPVEVRFKGHREYPEWRGSLTVVPVGASWGVAVDGPHIDEFTDAFNLNGASAGILEREAPAGGTREQVGVTVRVFDESKVKRDRKGRFAEKGAAAVLSELDEMMEKLRALSKHLDEDEQSDLDNALDYLKDVHRSKKKTVDAGGRDYIEVDSDQYHNLQMQMYSDGDISVEHDEGELTLTPEEAEEIAEAIDEFRGQIPATPTPGRVAEKTTSSGNYVVALWGTGDIEVGPSEFFESSGSGEDGEEDEIVTLVIGSSEGATAVAIADALEELAETGANMKKESGRLVGNEGEARKFDQPRGPDGKWVKAVKALKAVADLLGDDKDGEMLDKKKMPRAKAPHVPRVPKKALGPRPSKKAPAYPRSADPATFFCRGYADQAANDGGKPGDPISFVASTPGVKRDGLDLRANGWRLDNFHQSPVFLWCHDKSSLPLGQVEARAESVLRSRVFFDQEDEFARKVESKYRRKFLRAVSVGWDFVDGNGQRMDMFRLRPEDIRDRAFYDLTELSGVPVPADPDALMESTRAGLRMLGRTLVGLYDEQENPAGELDADQMREAVWDEIRRLGIPIKALTGRPAREAGFFMPETTAPAASGDRQIDQDAARTLLAAFHL